MAATILYYIIFCNTSTAYNTTTATTTTTNALIVYLCICPSLSLALRQSTAVIQKYALPLIHLTTSS